MKETREPIMKGEIVGAALAISLGLAAHAYLATPRHSMTRLDENTVMKLDRWSGKVSMCAQWTDDEDNASVYCHRLQEWEEVEPVAPGNGERAST